MLSFLSLNRIILALGLASAIFTSNSNAHFSDGGGVICRFSHFDRNDPSKMPEWVHEDPDNPPFNLDSKDDFNYEKEADWGSYYFSYINNVMHIRSNVDVSKNKNGKNELRLYKIELLNKDNTPGDTKFVYLNDNDECHGNTENTIIKDGGKIKSITVVNTKWAPKRRRRSVKF